MPRVVDTTDPVVALHPAAPQPIALSVAPIQFVLPPVESSPVETQHETLLSPGTADPASFAALPIDDSDSVGYWMICPLYKQPIALADYRSLSFDYLLYRATYKHDETNVSPPTADPCLSPVLGRLSHRDFLWVTHTVSERELRYAISCSNHVDIFPKNQILFYTII